MIEYIVSVILLFVIYKLALKGYLTRQYYKKLGIPTTQTYIPVIGDAYHLNKINKKHRSFLDDVLMPIFLEDTSKPFIYTDPSATGPSLMTSQPEIAQKIFELVGSSLDKRDPGVSSKYVLDKSFIWMKTNSETKKRKTSFQPTFSHSNLKIYTAIFASCAEEYIKDHKYDKNKEVNMEVELSQLTLEAIGRAAFGNDFTKQKLTLKENGIVKEIKLQEAITESFNKMVMLNFKNPLIMLHDVFFKLDFNSYTKEFKSNVTNMKCAVAEVIRKREIEWIKEGKKVKNLLDMLLQKKDEGLLTFEDVLGESILFIFAGHETSGRTLTVLMYRLHLYPEIVKRMREEIKDVIFEGKDDIENMHDYVTYEKVQDLTYTTMCIKEALRIDPPVGAPINYIAKKDVEIAGVLVKEGTCCTPSIGLIHNNPHVWKNPREFIPERFDIDSEYYKTPAGAKRHPLSFMPFSAGPRNCIGQNFAMLEMKYLIVYLFSNFKFDIQYDELDGGDCNFAIGIVRSLPTKITKIGSFDEY